MDLSEILFKNAKKYLNVKEDFVMKINLEQLKGHPFELTEELQFMENYIRYVVDNDKEFYSSKKSDEADDYVNSLNLPFEINKKISEYFMDLEYMAGKSGYINGFRAGVKICRILMGMQ